MTIKQLRKQINEIDHAIINLLAERMDLVKRIGGLKRSEGKEPLDSDRWHQILMDRVAYARERGVSEQLIEKIWHEVHDHALEIEKSDE